MSSDQVLDRIAERDISRRKRLASAAATRQNEGNGDLDAVREQLNALRSGAAQDLKEATTQSTLSRVASLQAASDRLKALQQRLLEGAWLLPDHELRQQQSAAEALQEQIKAELSKDRPRNMFSLSKKQRSDPAAATASLQALALQAEAAAQVVSAAASPVAVPKRPDTTAPSQITNSVICGLTGQTIVRPIGCITEGELQVSDLVDCTVLLLAPLSTLRLQRLLRCTVAAGPVSGSAFLNDLDECSVVLAAHQFRCHSSRDTTAWLRVSSNPIIEDCTGMVFGGLTHHHTNVLLQQDAADTVSKPHSHMSSSGRSESPPAVQSSSCAAEELAAATDAPAWVAVQDFNHVHSATSPNWRTATEDEIQKAPRLEVEQS